MAKWNKNKKHHFLHLQKTERPSPLTRQVNEARSNIAKKVIKFILKNANDFLGSDDKLLSATDLLEERNNYNDVYSGNIHPEALFKESWHF